MRGNEEDLEKTTRLAPARLDSCQLFQVGLQDVPLQHEVGELAVSLDSYKPRVFKFLHMVGKCCRADVMAFVQLRASHGVVRSERFQDFITARLGQSARDQRKLPFRQSAILTCCHYLKTKPPPI